MALAVTVAADDSTPIVGQIAKLTLTVDNTTDTYDMTIHGVSGVCTSPGAPAIEFDAPNVTAGYAGVGATVVQPVAIAAGGSDTFEVNCVVHKAGTYTVNVIAYGNRTDTGAAIALTGSSAATLTVS